MHIMHAAHNYCTARQKHRQAEAMTNAEDTDKILYYHTDPQAWPDHNLAYA